MIRLSDALVGAWLDSYPRAPRSVTLDIDDTCNVVHGHQQLSFYHVYYEERCFLPINVYDTDRSRPVAIIPRAGKTPSGVEVRGHLRRLVRRIRTRWSRTRILLRGDSHCARPKSMEWCEINGIDCVFGLVKSKPLSTKADAVRTKRALTGKAVVHGYAETHHNAKPWARERGIAAVGTAATAVTALRLA